MNNYWTNVVRKSLKFLPQYKKVYHSLHNGAENILLHSYVMDAINNVPYYSSYRNIYHSESDFKCLPIIRKSDIMRNEKSFISKKACKRFLSKKETGGSTGLSLELFYSISTIIKKEAVRDFLFSINGHSKNIATLRGNKPRNGEIVEVVNRSNIILSSYKLTTESIDVYVKALNDYKIDCLHVYPSSLIIFARLINQLKRTPTFPYLKKIIASSEIFSKEDKLFIKRIFPEVQIIDYYGHNELACAAISVDNSPYTFLPSYGYVEFIETSELTPSGNRIAEIVATSILNADMPFIRYATDDYVELDKQGNPIAIIGRSSDFVVNRDKQLVPCIISTRPKSMENVISFQYYQDVVGKLTFKIKVSKEYSNQNEKFLLEDLNNSFADIDCNIEIVDEIERTKRGKQLRMIQKLNINEYK